MAGISGQVHERVKYQKNNKKKSRTKTRKGGWQALGFKSYQHQLIAKKNVQLDQEGDVLVVISASGNSPNVVTAVEWVNANGGITLGLVGFDGGKLLELCHYSILCKTEKWEYGPVEDFHMIIDHMINGFILL